MLRHFISRRVPWRADSRKFGTYTYGSWRPRRWLAERARFERANGVRPLRHFQCGLPKRPTLGGGRLLNFDLLLNSSSTSVSEWNDCCATARGRRLVSQRSTATTCRGQRYGRASGGLLHAKPNVALPTLAVDRVVVARRLIGKVMPVGAQAIGGPVVQRGVGGGGLSVDRFAHCKAGSAGAIIYGQ